MKSSAELDRFCTNLPDQFITYILYVRGLSFEQKPDYDYLQALVLEMAVKFDFRLDDNLFDWCITLKCQNLHYTQVERLKDIIIKYRLTKEQSELASQFEFQSFKHVHEIMKNYYDQQAANEQMQLPNANSGQIQAFKQNNKSKQSKYNINFNQIESHRSGGAIQ